MVNGESIPVQKQAGDPIIGATINGTGGLVIRAEKVGAETLPSRIVAMVAAAQRSRAPIQKLADAVAGYFVPFVILSAVAGLIIACPCALGLATPMSMSIMVATGKGASVGLLFKNAEAIEVLRKVDTLVVDKTGMPTEGKPKLVSVVAPGDGVDEATLLRLAASLEAGALPPENLREHIRAQVYEPFHASAANTQCRLPTPSTSKRSHERPTSGSCVWADCSVPLGTSSRFTSIS